MTTATSTFDPKYYFRFAWFRLKEPWTDVLSNIAGYALYAFFMIILAEVWQRFQAATSSFVKSEVILYIGVTEMFYMTFLRKVNIVGGMEDFAVFLAKPRSWIGREFFGNVGAALGQRLAFLAVLVLLAVFVGALPGNPIPFLARILFLLVALAPSQALLTALFSSFRLSFPQTDYFILPFGKLFLSFGGVFAPLSDFGEPYRSTFLRLPGSDLFFQAGHFAVKGEFYQMTLTTWIVHILAINAVLFLLLIFFFRMGKRRFQAWGG